MIMRECLGFTHKQFGFSKDIVEEGYKVMIDALSNDGIVEDSVLQSAIDETKAAANIPSRTPHRCRGLQARRDGKIKLQE